MQDRKASNALYHHYRQHVLACQHVGPCNHFLTHFTELAGAESETHESNYSNGEHSTVESLSLGLMGPKIPASAAGLPGGACRLAFLMPLHLS